MRMYATTLLLFFIGLSCSGQELKEIEFYINRPDISTAAKQFCNKAFKASDDSLTLSIMDSLNTRNDITRPFYIYLVSTMLTKADGALAEALGVVCKDFIESNPDHLIELLFAKNNKNKKFVFDWAMRISDEFVLDDCGGKLKKCLEDSKRKAIQKVNESNRDHVAAVYEKIEKFANAK